MTSTETTRSTAKAPVAPRNNAPVYVSFGAPPHHADPVQNTENTLTSTNTSQPPLCTLSTNIPIYPLLRTQTSKQPKHTKQPTTPIRTLKHSMNRIRRRARLHEHIVLSQLLPIVREQLVE